jgi:hypothetical protein
MQYIFAFLLTRTHLGKSGQQKQLDCSQKGLAIVKGHTVVPITVTVLCGVPPRGLVGHYQQFGKTFCHLPQERGVSL